MGKSTRRFYLAVFTLFGTVHCQSALGASSQPETCAVDPNAIVSDACASYSTLDQLNSHLQPTLRSLTHDSDFFSYYRLNLYDKVCPFWSDEGGLCGNIACAVNTIENEEDIPTIWRADELGKLEGPKAHHPARPQQKKERPLMGELGANVGESCVVEYDDECDERDYCVPEDESSAGKGDYVSLVDNPERFTGYSGPSAHQVWEAIYGENCFTNDAAPGIPSSSGSSDLSEKAAQDLHSVIRDNSPPSSDECLEKRTFYRIISGMHASISTHLCYDYLNQTTGQWGPNLACYEERLHGHPDRISNLYFNYALVLRAVAKVRNALTSYTYCSGDPEQDSMTKEKVLALADQISRGPKIYDESLMFRDPSIVGLKEDFRNRFRNVSRTMDCVGCDKCRLWGKLQTAGYGTALKILFEFNEKDNSQNPPLRRTELVALVNTLDRISHSLSAIGKFEEMLHGKSVKAEKSNIPVAEVLRDEQEPVSVRAVEGEAQTPGTEAPGLQDAPAQDTASVQEDTASIQDDGFRDYTFIEHEDPEDPWHEVRLIWHTSKWVLSRWLDMPRTLFEMAVLTAHQLWDFWLGRGITSLTGFRRIWEVQYPPPMPERRRATLRRERDEI